MWCAGNATVTSQIDVEDHTEAQNLTTTSKDRTDTTEAPQLTILTEVHAASTEDHNTTTPSFITPGEEDHTMVKVYFGIR